MSAVPDDITITWEAPDEQGRIRVRAMSSGKEIGAATAVPDSTNPDAMVISDMHFRDPDHWSSLGQTLLDKLVVEIERTSPHGRQARITASLDNIRFREAVTDYGSRVTYRP